VIFLGHVISAKGVLVDPRKVEVVLNWDRPSNVIEIQSYLGLDGYYRRFIDEFSLIATHLTWFTRKEMKFEW